MHPKIFLFILVTSAILYEIFRGYFRRFFEPLRSITPKKTVLFTAAACVIALFFLDPFLVAWIQKFTASFEGIVTFGRTIGKNNYFWYTLLALYLIPAILRKTSLRRYAFGILVSSALTALIVTALKFVFLRARPTANAGSLSFFNLEGLTKDMSNFQSFPSGDVSLVAGASFYLFFALRNFPIRWLFLILPLTTAMARIHLNRHWPSDTLTSMLIACFAGLWVYTHARGAAEKKN